MRSLLAASAVCCFASINAQVSRPELGTVAIVNARVESGAGDTWPEATVVTKDGTIVAVGPQVKAPVGARVVDGKGLWVFPGFVDAGVSTGLHPVPARPRQSEPVDDTVDFPTSMPDAPESVRPDVRAADLFDADNAAWKSARSAGFTTALIYPPAGILKGQAALVSLDGRARSQAVISSPVALALGLQGGGGGYPGTPLGAFATVRQAFLDAGSQRDAQAAYSRGGPHRPVDNPALDAVNQLVSAGTPLLIDAEDSWQISSALKLAADIGVKPIVLGGRASHRWPAELKGTPVVLSLNFGPEPAVKKEGEEPAVTEPKAATAERQRLWLQHVTTAKVLADAGVEFAFTSKGCKDLSTFFTNLRRAVKEGLPRETALAALTAVPARIFGLGRRMGTIQVGQAANLTVLTADFTDDKSKVKVLVIDGILVDPAKEPFKFDNSVRGDFGEEKR